MSRWKSLFLPISIILLLAACGQSTNFRYQEAASGEVVILAAFGETRSGTQAWLSCLAAEVERIRQERGAGQVLLVHTGNIFGTDPRENPAQAEATISLMNALGFDFMVFGNHDFDLGWSRTRELAMLAEFPVRGANVLDRQTGEPASGDQKIVRRAGGLRVGLLGLGYRGTPLLTKPENIEGLVFASGVESTRRLVPQMRRRSDLLAVVSHQGMEADERLAREVTGIDLIIGIGGDSRGQSEPLRKIGPTWMLQPFGDSPGLEEIVVRMEAGRVVQVMGRTHPLGDECRGDR